jgi:formylglycine-generating enzyme required for sulfatase activity
MKKTILSLLLAVGLIGSVSQSKADTFGTGDAQFRIDFTTIGNPGNAADTTGYGKVDYTYRIGTYEISQNQIDAARASGLQNVTAGPWSGDQPAANMSWYESAAFVNWLNTSTGNQAAYNLTWSGSTWSMALWTVSDAGYDANNLYRNSLAKYFLLSENEFYKAAYGKTDGSGYYLYPTASNSPPTAVASGTTAGTAIYQNTTSSPASIYEAGGLSSHGTMGQGGNVWEFIESATDGVNDDAQENRGRRGGAYSSAALTLQSSSYRFSVSPGRDFYYYGFRVASVVPEPSTYALFGIGAIGMLMVLRRKKESGQAF